MPYLLLVLFLCLPLTSHAEIFKWVDEKGIHFADEAPPGVDAEKVTVRPPNKSSSASPRRSNPPSSQPAEDAPTQDNDAYQQVRRYSELEITHPNDDQALRANSGNVSITCALNPTLQSAAGHQVRFLLDGQPFSVESSCNTTMEELDRGTHQVSAEVIDQQGRILIRSSANKFHLQRHSRL